MRRLCFVLLFGVAVGGIYYLSATIRTNYASNSNYQTPIIPLSDIIKDDWLVNDDTVGGCPQAEPSIAHTNTNYIVVWTDYRNGYAPDIYMGRFNFSGFPLGPVVRVNTDSGDNYPKAPAVAADSAGNFVVVWEDKRERRKKIYAQRYDKNATPIGTNFRVGDELSQREQHTPVVAMSNSGSFMVAWKDERGSSPYIYAQVYDASGNPIGSNFVVDNDTLVGAFQAHPNICRTTNNEFAVVWINTCSGIKIYCQRYTCSGTPVRSKVEVNNNTNIRASMERPVIRSNCVNRTVIVWSDSREHLNYSNIYAQLYDADWNPIDTNFRVNNDTAHTQHEAPSVTVDYGGNFIITWSDKRESFPNPDVYAQRYDKMGNPQNGNFKVNEDSPGHQLEEGGTVPVVDIDTVGNFLVLWQDNSDIDREILAQIYSQTGTPIGGNFSLIMDEGMRNQQNPQIAMNMRGNFVVVWEDERGPHKVIFGQRYDEKGNPVGVNWQVSDISRIAHSPSVAIDPMGNFVVVWVSRDKFGVEDHIYARKYTNDGVPMGAEFKIDSQTVAPKGFIKLIPSVAMNKEGNFIVVWEDYRNNSKYGDIYGQKFRADCPPIGSNFDINRIIMESEESPHIVMNEDGAFIVVWQQGRGGQALFDIYGQKFNSSGDLVGGNFQISDNPMAHLQQVFPSAASHNEGNLVVVWQDSRRYDEEKIYDVYAQVYDRNGLLVGSNFRVNQSSYRVKEKSSSVAMHPWTKECIVVWTECMGTISQIMAQKVDSLGGCLGGNYRINNPVIHPGNSRLSSTRSVASNGECVAIVWSDNRRLKGWDIYAKLVNWGFTKKEETSVGRVSLQVDPNPSIKYLTIRYTVPTVSLKLMVTIYDIAGRVAAEYLSLKSTPGKHTYQIDVSGFKSGIYFIKLHTVPISIREDDYLTDIHKVVICH